MRNRNQDILQAAPSVSDLYEQAKNLIKEALYLKAQGAPIWLTIRAEIELEIIPCLPRNLRMMIKLSIARLDRHECAVCGQSMSESHYYSHHRHTCPPPQTPHPAPSKHLGSKRESRQLPPAPIQDPKRRAASLLAQMEEAHAAGDMRIARVANDMLNEMQDQLDPETWQCQIAPRIERTWCPEFELV